MKTCPNCNFHGVFTRYIVDPDHEPFVPAEPVLYRCEGEECHVCYTEAEYIALSGLPA